jgi:hypothetical protein
MSPPLESKRRRRRVHERSAEHCIAGVERSEGMPRIRCPQRYRMITREDRYSRRLRRLVRAEGDEPTAPRRSA